MDPNYVNAYAPSLAEIAPDVVLPDLHYPALSNEAFAEGRRIGTTSFPTFLLKTDRCSEALPMIYDPDERVRLAVSVLSALGVMHLQAHLSYPFMTLWSAGDMDSTYNLMALR
ncbi:hypothetical protein [Ahrensia sp. R2A130]|uniref:hypothetical protein n=1 Tax=Ahrensia sp. R2A130 TaxID=744979 RepID=UPI0001E0E043|nr:hypothetical protein [Ahrensia sp. R2A130]EFL90898.1 conserved hypothetical protein [Ahrensia sp. R2A130]